MEKINLSHEIEQDSFLSQLLIDVMTNYCAKHNIEMEEAFNLDMKSGVGCLLNARLSIGNVELDLRSFVACLKEQHDELLTNKAKQLIVSRIKNVKCLLDKLEEQVNNALQNADDVGEIHEG